MNHFYTDCQRTFRKSLKTKFRGVFFFSFFFWFNKCTFIMCCAKWNWETNLKSLNDFCMEAVSVMWEGSYNSSTQQLSPAIYKHTTSGSNTFITERQGKKNEEGRVCVIPLIKSQESGAKVTFPSKIICSWQISVGRCYYSRMNTLALGKKSIFSEIGVSKSLWCYSITT